MDVLQPNDDRTVIDEARACALEYRALPANGHLGSLRRVVRHCIAQDRPEQALRELTALQRRFEQMMEGLDDIVVRDCRFHLGELLRHIARIACRFGSDCSSEEQRQADRLFKREFLTFAT